MPRGLSRDTSVDFEIYANINDTEDYIVFEATAHYEVESDDPAYDPRSGNSLTTQWCPTTYVELSEVELQQVGHPEELENILAEHNIKDTFIFKFSYDQDDLCDGTKDNRPELEINVSEVSLSDILKTHKAEVMSIAESFASDIDVEDI
jgi:hypothetical protein